MNKFILKYTENYVLSIYSLSSFKDYVYKDLDFYMRVRAYEKHVCGKQPLRKRRDEDG